MVSKNLFYELGIELKSNSIQQKTKCPNCKKIGKENYQDTCLSVNLNDGLYNCHKCGWNGCVVKGNTISYQKPIKTNFTKFLILVSIGKVTRYIAVIYSINIFF